MEFELEYRITGCAKKRDDPKKPEIPVVGIFTGSL
jgi:hypothetical protein